MESAGAPCTGCIDAPCPTRAPRAEPGLPDAQQAARGRMPGHARRASHPARRAPAGPARFPTPPRGAPGPRPARPSSIGRNRLSRMVKRAARARPSHQQYKRTRPKGGPPGPRGAPAPPVGSVNPCAGGLRAAPGPPFGARRPRRALPPRPRLRPRARGCTPERDQTIYQHADIPARLKAAVASSHGSSFASYARVVHAQCSTRPFHRRQTSLPLGNSALAPVLRQCAQYEVAPNVWRAEPRRFPLPACRRQLRQAVAVMAGGVRVGEGCGGAAVRGPPARRRRGGKHWVAAAALPLMRRLALETAAAAARSVEK